MKDTAGPARAPAKDAGAAGPAISLKLYLIMKTPQVTHSGDELTLLPKFDYPSRIAGETRGPVICAWCEDVIEEGFGPVSHGMCPSCHADFLATLPEE